MLHFIPFLFFCPHFCIVLDIMGCSSDFCHIFTGFTTFRWGGRWLGASDMDVFCSDIFILCETSEVKELWSLGLNSSTEHKLQTPTWALEWRSLSPGTSESWHTWWRWCFSVFCPLSLRSWMSSTALDPSTCWGRMNSKWLRKAATRAT